MVTLSRYSLKCDKSTVHVAHKTQKVKSEDEVWIRNSGNLVN